MNMERELISRLKELKEKNPQGYLAMVALLHAIARKDHPSAPIKSSRGDFKRAIRALRKIQGMVEYPDDVEDAVALIRREWLHREEAQ